MLAFGFEQMEDDVHVRKSSLNFVAVDTAKQHVHLFCFSTRFSLRRRSIQV